MDKNKELIKILKSLVDDNRLRILFLLHQKELCVCEIEELLGISQSNASRHLIKLKDADLINSEKQGQFVMHSINKDTLKAFPFLRQLFEQLAGFEKFTKDKEKVIHLQEKGILSCNLKK